MAPISDMIEEGITYTDLLEAAVELYASSPAVLAAFTYAMVNGIKMDYSRPFDKAADKLAREAHKQIPISVSPHSAAAAASSENAKMMPE